MKGFENDIMEWEEVGGRVSYLKLFLIQISHFFQKTPCFIGYFWYATTMKFAIIWLSVTIAAAIIAPVMAFFIALLVFFSSWIAFMKGVQDGLMNLKYPNNTPPAEEEDLWDRHIKNMEKKNNKNNAE